jgi:hypothetical protein
MDPHPIPKNLMDVEFKLFGSLTVNQFASLAICFLFALIVHLATIPALIEVPLKVGFVLLGLALAFFKVNGLTFDKFLTYYFAALFTPQRMIWKKENKIPDSLTASFEVPKVVNRNSKNDLVAAVINDLAEEEILNIQTTEKFEQKKLNQIDNYLNEVGKSNLRQYKPQKNGR